ncbi:unnamed protein product, partial [marine sediment metagenome]
MKCAVLFSGGKDSTYAGYLAKQQGHELTCLISMVSENPESYMFHTPNIMLVKKQAEIMELPLLIQPTEGKKEEELLDLERIIYDAIHQFKIEAVITGAMHSDYQKSRIQKICNLLRLKCINPLWHKDEIEYLDELIKNK